MDFNERILLWQPFFITVATVAATLVGLLFVSLSINRDTITSESNRHLLRLARRSFSDFIFVLLIALFFLIPLQSGHTLGIELVVIGIFRVRLLFRQIKTSGGGQKADALDLAREYVLPVLSTAGLLVAGLGLYEESIKAVYYFVVPVNAILLITACSNAWLLLVMEKK